MGAARTRARERTGSNGAIPPLESGDRLSRAEFERRYDAMPHLKKAELINGVVYVASPVRVEEHAEPHFDLVGWMAHYKAGTPGLRGGDNASARLDLESMPQPDALLFIDPARGGQARIGPDRYLEGAPEMAAEVSASTASLDLNDKLELYRRAGVREYVVWRVLDGEIDWFVRRGQRFVRMRLSRDGLYRSKVFPGLWLDPDALVRGDMVRVLAVVQQGLATPEHAAFVAKLNAARP